MDQADFEILERLEAGASVFRPEARTDAARLGFEETVRRLMALRDRGLIRLPEGRVARSSSGAYLMVGPCDRTEAGRAALARDRALGPRPKPSASRGHA